MACAFDPVPLAGGMMHCPECGEMVVCGVPHPDYSLLDLPPDDPFWDGLKGSGGKEEQDGETDTGPA